HLRRPGRRRSATSNGPRGDAGSGRVSTKANITRGDAAPGLGMQSFERHLKLVGLEPADARSLPVAAAPPGVCPDAPLRHEPSQLPAGRVKNSTSTLGARLERVGKRSALPLPLRAW